MKNNVFLVILLLSINVSAQSESFNFRKYKAFDINDTIQIDLNGNGIIEKVYFTQTECKQLIIDELGSELISIGCENNKYFNYPDQVDWVNQWCVVYDKNVWEVLFTANGEIVMDTIVTLKRPGIYIGKKESGGGIITYRNGKLYWVHQSD